MENGVGSTKENNLLSRMALNDNKAGMEGLDRDKINRIIMEASKVDTFLLPEILHVFTFTESYTPEIM